MADRSDTWIVALVMVAAASVLAAPVIGRLGFPVLATVTMVLAAGSGLASFGLAGLATLRAARRTGSRRAREERS